MGAGGSTAASCSSLDLSNGQVPDKYRYYRQQNRHQQYLHEQRLLKYKKQARGAKSGYLKQSSSQFDLTSCGVADNGDPYLRDDAVIQYGLTNSQAAAEAYNLTDSDMARPMPAHTVMVLPPLPASKHPGVGAKKSNAGVASRILHQRQQQQQRRSCELKKFSDSLPSLNNILATPRHDNMVSIDHPKSHQAIHHHQHQRFSPPQATFDCHERTKLAPSPSKQHLMRPSYRSSAIQANHKQQLLKKHQGQVTNTNLVIDEPYRAKQSQWRAQNMTDHDGRELPQSVLIKRQHVGSQLGKHGPRPQMKRATSLSSLHNLNQSHHQQDNHYHPRDGCHQHDSNITKRSSANLCHPSDFTGRSPRPPSINSCRSTDIERQHLLTQQYQHQLRAQRRLAYDPQVQPCDLLGGQYRLPPQTSPKHQQSSSTGNAMLTRKNYKYKQAPNASVHLSKNNRYKSKQQQQPQVQGCPVLPPMPRSQSLHELIQLRATENGQRMRTTGTLRGPFGNGEQANKVNLVAELLENRRQQRQTQNDDDGRQQEPHAQQVNANQNSETLLSQSSSTDDGIHDVSLNGNTNSPQTQLSPNNRSSISSQECDKSAASRQRIFKRQAATSAQIDRLSHQKSTINDSQQDGRSDRLDRHQSKKSQHKSTLKRSASHSALHHRACNISDSYDQDGDESDDLNELAKFLYEFKQRQAKNQAAQACQSGKSTDDALAGEQQATSNSAPRNQVDTNFQQSPNSTTSSSGFASSTCTAHSISSASGRDMSRAAADDQHGDKFLSVSSSSSREAGGDVARSASAKVLAPKKYPAPPRPCDPGKSKNCPISGKIKASSSLLSIVDECQPPPPSYNQGQLQETLLAPGSSNLEQGQLCDADYRFRARGDGHKLEVDEFKIDRDRAVQSDNKQQQLEQLRMYTNMRQMSRSELALNHLTSSAVLDPAANRKQQKDEIMQAKQQKRNGGESSKKPYTNRLFNLIRRISDKSEAPNGGGRDSSCRESSCGDSIASASERRSSAGRLSCTNKYSSDAAGGRYGELNGGCQPIGGREEINQKSELMNSGYPNKSSGGGGHSERQRSALSGQLSGSTDEACGQLRSGRPGDARLCRAPAASESLCDLNFDCDFELIKRCGSAANESGRARARADAAAAASQNGVDHNESTRRHARKSSCSENKRSKQGRGECPIIDPTGRENNWRLAPTSSLLGLTHFSRGGGDGAVNGAAPSPGRPFVKHDNDNYNNGGGSGSGSSEKSAGGKTKFATEGGSSFDVRGGTRAEGKLPTVQQPQQQQQNKPKWSASSWFLGGTGSSGNSGNSGKKKDKSSGSCRSQETGPNADKCESKPSKEKSYLARLLPNSGGTASSSSGSRSKSNSNSKSKQNECDNSEADGGRCDMITEADQLLVELDQSLDLVSGSSRRRRSGRPSGGDLSVPWWQQVSSKITEEEARMMHEAQLNAISGDESSTTSDSDDDGDDNDDADYASINRALINETFDVDLSTKHEGDHSNLDGGELTIEQPGSPSDSFTFSAPSSPTPLERSPRAPANSASFKLREPAEIDDANIATNGLSKQPGLDNALERSAQDKQRSSEGGKSNVAAPCSSKFTYNRSAKTTPTKAAAAVTRAPASPVTNCSSSDEQGARVKLGVGAAATAGGCVGVGNNKHSSNLERGGVCRPVVAVASQDSKCHPEGGRHITNQMAEAAGKKPPAPTDNKIVAPSSSSENSRTFTKVIPQGNIQVATSAKRHPHRDETAELSQVVRGTQMKGVVHGSQMPSQLPSRQTAAAVSLNDGTRCMTNIVRRDNEFADADVSDLGRCALRNDKAKKLSPVSGRRLDASAAADNPARSSGSNDVIGRVANGNKIKSVCLNCHAGDSDDRRPPDSGAKSSSSSDSRRAPGSSGAKDAFNDPLCPIHGKAICCAHSSAGQGETEGNLKQQQRPRRHQLSGQCQLDTNSVERCGYDTESDNGRPRGLVESRKFGSCSAAEEVTARAPGFQCAQVVAGSNAANSGANPAAHKLACHRPNGACENGGSGMSDNGLRSCNGSSAAAMARTKPGRHEESVVCNHRPVTPEEIAAGGNNKLIIQRSSCLCDASDPLPSSPLANENLGAPGKRVDGKSLNFSHQTPSNCCPAAASVNGCTPRKGNGSPADCDGNTSSSPKVTYYHYSHEMKNFAPTTAAAPSGKLRVDSRDRCCGGAEGSDQCRPGKQQHYSDKCFCITTTPGASGGGNNFAKNSEITCSGSSLSSSCKTGCRYHPHNSSSHDDARSSCHPANEDVKVSPSCCSRNKTKKPSGGGGGGGSAALPDQFPPGKNKAADALKPMTGNDNERRTKSSEMTDCCQVVSPSSSSSSQVAARNDEYHCCHVSGSTGAAQTNGQVAATACPDRLHSHAKCNPTSSKQLVTPVRCNPICRSNSELVADMPPAGGRKSGQDRRVSDVLFGRLRNSLLNQRAGSPSSANQKNLLGSSQASLANHYGDGGTQQLIHSMLIPSAVGVGSSSVVHDFDDNFILKRKTPNAGLKSRC